MSDELAIYRESSSPVPEGWFPPREWTDFLDMRKKRGLRTDYAAQDRLLRHLARICEQGFDPLEVIRQSLDRGLQSFYPIREEKRVGPSSPMSEVTTEESLRLDRLPVIFAMRKIDANQELAVESGLLELFRAGFLVATFFLVPGWYALYLQTDHWKGRRERSLELANHTCQVCKATSSLQVHHNTYERVGRELDTDLIVLCRECHDLFHRNGKLAKRPG